MNHLQGEKVATEEGVGEEIGTVVSL